MNEQDASLSRFKSKCLHNAAFAAYNLMDHNSNPHQGQNYKPLQS